MRTRWLIALILVMICLAYANHFQNSFHFDDSHTIIDNPSIRSLKNVPVFFSDAAAFSVLPGNRTWRPLISTSLALDYWIAGGLNPTAFHVSTMLWFLLLIWILFRLSIRIFDAARPGVDNSLAAGFTAALFGLHPACAETLNYVIQRGDLYATLGVTAGVYLYTSHPGWRKYGIYLLPVLAAQLSKPPALVFPVLLFVYLLLIENRSLRSAASGAIPGLCLTIFMAILQARMTPASFSPGAASAYEYRITQPFVALRYFAAFFLPVRLSADTDLSSFGSAFDPLALCGFAFLGGVVATAIFYSRDLKTRPIAFGLWWFLAALAPTSLFPLAELENDHRMFFPFVGLAIAVVWAITLLWPSRVSRRVSTVAAILLLAACAWGVHVRNEIWRSEATLWRDVTLKSPHNGRGLMNYALCLLSSGDRAGALDYMQRALIYTPSYYMLEINLGIVYGDLQNDAEAESHFQRAMALAPEESLPYQYYARWLSSRNRTADALVNARKAVALNPSNPNSQELLRRLETVVREAEESAAANPTGANYLTLSLRYCEARRYNDCIRAAQNALARQPDLAEAYNNIAAAHEELGQWDAAIAAANQAIRLKPDFQLARNNLGWSLTQKALAVSKTKP